MANRNLERSIYNEISNYINLIDKSENALIFTKRFADLFENIGNKLLLLHEDIELSYRFYSLSMLINESTKTKNPDFFKWFNLFQTITSFSFYFENRECQSNEENELIDKYSEIIQSLNRESPKEINNRANAFIEYTLSSLNSNLSLSVLKLKVALGIAIKQSTSIYSLACLSEATSEEQRDYTFHTINLIKSGHCKTIANILNAASISLNEIKEVNLIYTLANTYCICKTIKHALQISKINTDICYYTSYNAFCYMLPDFKEPKKDGEGKFSVFDMAYMNDPQEGSILKQMVYNIENPMPTRKGRELVNKNRTYMKCFTSMIDYLPMWEIYGDHAQGLCVVLNWNENKMSTFIPNQFPLFRVCYLKKDTKTHKYNINKNDNRTIENNTLEIIKTNIKSLETIYEKWKKILGENGTSAFDYLIESISFLFKDNRYHYEEELRIVYQHDDINELLLRKTETDLLFIQPSFPVSIREIIIGPKFKDKSSIIPILQQRTKEMAEHLNLKCPDITYSVIQYR